MVRSRRMSQHTPFYNKRKSLIKLAIVKLIAIDDYKIEGFLKPVSD